MAYTDRLIEAYQKVVQGDWSNALIQICINLDMTAKKTYGGKPGARIKRYIRENQYALTRIAMLHLEIHGDMSFQVSDNKYLKFEEIIYKLVRCALLHEGELDKRIKIVKSDSLGVESDGRFVLSEHMIYAFFLLLVSDPQNARIKWPTTASFTAENKTYSFSVIQRNTRKLIDIFRKISKEKSNKANSADAKKRAAD